MPTDQIGDCVLISRSVQTTPSSTKPPIHYNNTKTAESQQPTSAADISHLADAAWQPKSADWIANRTPIPDPVRATHPDSRPSTRPIPSKPQNTNTPPAHSTAAAIPTTTTQPKSASQIANHWPIPNPAQDHAARHRITCNGSTMKPAEYQHSTSAADISHLATNHGSDQIHGPNRKSLADSRSGPHDTTSQQTTNRDNHQNRRIPTLKQRPEDDQPIHRPSDSPRQRTKSEITY